MRSAGPAATVGAVARNDTADAAPPRPAPAASGWPQWLPVVVLTEWFTGDSVAARRRYLAGLAVPSAPGG